MVCEWTVTPLVNPDGEIISIIAQGRDITPQIEADPTQSVFYTPFKQLQAGDPTAARGAAAIRTVVVPAFRHFGEFLRDEYIPRCRGTLIQFGKLRGHRIGGFASHGQICRRGILVASNRALFA